jgi:trimethylamine-N-oxide reductase (cytochrome c)
MPCFPAFLEPCRRRRGALFARRWPSRRRHSIQGVQRLTNLTTGGPVHVDVHDGKILRLIPLQLDETDGPSRRIEARERTFDMPRRTTLSPWTVAHRSTIYSSKRILTPLKRTDFDPHDERNIS